MYVTMRSLVHISDLHFGRSEAVLIAALLETLEAFEPDLVVISGDLTQRAEKKEFVAAKDFLDALDARKMRHFVIPGNHDIAPIYRPLKRIRSAYHNYHTYISKKKERFFHDGEIAVASINTVKRTHPVNGRVTYSQTKKAALWLAQFPEAVKVVVTHHPLNRNANRRSKMACWRGQTARTVLDAASVDVYLCGHHHRSSVSSSTALEVHAGTLSTRLRGEPASFNVLRFDATHIEVTTHRWDKESGSFTGSEPVYHARAIRSTTPAASSTEQVA